jgi:hypothetical protein
MKMNDDEMIDERQRDRDEFKKSTLKDTDQPKNKLPEK